ncbi:MAG TPA: 5'-nucleotidase C-terminal domain-containing protein [Thermoanaerobaculia bacterium]
MSWLPGLLLVFGLPLAASQQVTLLHVNDSHSHLAAWGPKDDNLDGTLGGLPKAAAIIAAATAEDSEALFVHAGDYMHGDLFFNEYIGIPELQILKALGLDAMVLGNRDFQLGPDFVVDTLEGAWSTPVGGVPVLGTNLVPGEHPLGGWTVPTLMLSAHGVKIGLLGVTDPKGPMAKPSPVTILPPKDPAQEAVNTLRDDGAQVIVCLAHLGMAKARALASAVSGIDVIVNAHDNAELTAPEPVARLGGGTTWIVSAGHLYEYVGRLRLSVDGDAVTVVDYALLHADGKTAPLEWVQAETDGLQAGIVARYGDVYRLALATASSDITAEFREGKGDTALGMMYPDAYRALTGTDIAIEAMGYIDDPIPRGAVLGADVFRGMSISIAPAEVDGRQIVRPVNLVTFRSPGASLKSRLQFLLSMGDKNYFPQVSGMTIVYDSSAGNAIVEARIGGEPIVGDQLYSVTATKLVYNALRSVGLVTQDKVELPDLAFDAARAWVQSLGHLVPGTPARMRDSAADE